MSPSARRHLGPLLLLALINSPLTFAQTHGTTAAILDDWIANTAAGITYAGPGPRSGSVSPFHTRVIYCDTRTGNECGGLCTVYTGPGSQCFATPGTSCVASTTNVTFCATSNCDPRCNWYTHCGTKMDYGFCWTPGTGSILLPELQQPSSSTIQPSTSSTMQQVPTSEPPPPPPPSSDPPPPPPSSDTSTSQASSSSSSSTTTTGVSLTSSSSGSPSSPSSSSTNLPSQSNSPGPQPSTSDAAAVGDSEGSQDGVAGAGEQKSAFPIGAIVGIVLGTLVIICATILIIFWLKWRQRREEKAFNEHGASTIPFMSTTSTSTGPSTSPPPMSYTGTGQTSSWSSPPLLPADNATSEITSTITSSTTSRPLRKGETVDTSASVARPADIPAAAAAPVPFVVVHADSGLRAPRAPAGGQNYMIEELPPRYTPS